MKSRVGMLLQVTSFQAGPGTQSGGTLSNEATNHRGREHSPVFLYLLEVHLDPAGI